MNWFDFGCDVIVIGTLSLSIFSNSRRLAKLEACVTWLTEDLFELEDAVYAEDFDATAGEELKKNEEIVP